MKGCSEVLEATQVNDIAEIDGSEIFKIQQNDPIRGEFNCSKNFILMLSQVLSSNISSFEIVFAQNHVK